MIVRVHTPAFPLQHFIEHFVYYEGVEVPHALDRFLPDGNTELIISLTDKPQFIYDNESLSEIQTCRRAWVSGIRTKPITIPSGNGSKMFIVAFKKGGAHPFYSFPMSELTDWVVDANMIFGQGFNMLREQLIDSPTVEGMFALVENFLLRRGGDSLHTDHSSKCVAFAIASFANRPNQMHDLSHTIGYSQKHFIDLFKRKVGIPPKQYVKIMRFQQAIQTIEGNPSIAWNQLALDSGFYDQAHFINDFKRFSGFTPNEYVRRKANSLNYVPVQ